MDYHWEYQGDEIPPQLDNDAFVFHVYRANNYTTYCYNATSGSTPISFMKNYGRIVWVFWIYVIMYFAYRMLIYFG